MKIGIVLIRVAPAHYRGGNWPPLSLPSFPLNVAGMLEQP